MGELAKAVEYQNLLQKLNHMLDEGLVSRREIEEKVRKLERENNILRGENAQYAHQLHEYSYTIENQKRALETTKVTLEKLTKENKMLKELLKGEWE